MDFGSIIVTFLRLIIPISILRYPLGGFIACLALDTFDAPLVDIIARQGALFGGGFIDYHLIDKWLDLYFLFFAFLSSLKWQNSFAKKAAISLFSLRSLGVILFSLTKLRIFLFFFPNIFEFFYLYYLISKRYSPRFLPTSLLKLLIILIILGIPKLFEEYFIHIKQLKLVEVIELLTPFKIPAPTIWEWLKTLF